MLEIVKQCNPTLELEVLRVAQPWSSTAVGMVQPTEAPSSDLDEDIFSESPTIEPSETRLVFQNFSEPEATAAVEAATAS